MHNYDDYKFRCSSLGDIMTGVAKGWNVEKSVTCISKLVEIDRQIRQNRKPNNSNKYVEKGISQEEDAITLYSLFKGKMYRKNTERLTNDFITGEMDFFEGESVSKADVTIDTKCSWDLWTFPHKFSKLSGDYFDQGQGYMDLTGAKKHIVAFCLVNTPANLITDAKKRLAWKMGIIDQETDEYIKECIEIEKNMIFDMATFKQENPFFEFHIKEWNNDMDIKDRVLEFHIERDDKYIQAIHDRVKACREFMNKEILEIKIN